MSIYFKDQLPKVFLQTATQVIPRCLTVAADIARFLVGLIFVE